MVDPLDLREARRRAGLTQAQLARLVGVADGRRVAEWESGRAIPHPKTRARLSEALHLPQGEDVTLRTLRLRLGMTTEELASRIGVHRTTVVRWEAGAARPGASKRKELAKVLGVRVEELPT